MLTPVTLRNNNGRYKEELVRSALEAFDHVTASTEQSKPSKVSEYQP